VEVEMENIMAVITVIVLATIAKVVIKDYREKIRRYFLYRKVLKDIIQYRNESIVLYNQLKPLKNHLEEFQNNNPKIIDPLLASSYKEKLFSKSIPDVSPINRHVAPEFNKLVTAEDLKKDLNKYGHKHNEDQLRKAVMDNFAITEILKSTDKFKRFLEDNR